MIYIFTHQKLCLATPSHNFKLVKITHFCLIWDLKFANLNVYSYIKKRLVQGFTLLSLNLSTTSRELLSQFSTWSGWK